MASRFRADRVLAIPKPQMLATVDDLERKEGARVARRFPAFGGVRVILLAGGESVQAAISRLMATGRYSVVEPDYYRRALGTPVVPDDPDFQGQWGLYNDGSGGGVARADIHAEEGWETITAAPGVVVGMLDSGALLNHSDLMGNFWVNPAPGTSTSYPTISAGGGGTSSSIETDSLNGLNAVTMTGPPTDDEGHGTLTSGVVGAIGNNSIGVAGVAWKVQLMELEFLGPDGTGSTSDELPCIEYAIGHGVNIINASFGDSNFSQAEYAAIYAAQQKGIIFVCAAGNATENNDIVGEYPGDYPLDNIVTVGSSDARDLPSSFSNYGSGSVELFAPGEGIVTTGHANTSDYEEADGTSLAAPFVTGAAALLRAQFPSDTYRETINRILGSVDTSPGLRPLSLTGGRLNLAAALTAASGAPVNTTFSGRILLSDPDPYVRSNNADSPAALDATTPSLGSGAGHSLWWQWTAPENATATIDSGGIRAGARNGGTSYPSAIAVYTGGSTSTLSLVASSSDYASNTPIGGGPAVPYGEVKFEAAAGTAYQINIQGLGGASGQTILSVVTDPDNDAFAKAEALAGPSVSLTDANVNASREANEPTILGNGGGHSLWYSWTAPASGTYQFSGYSYDFVPEMAVYTGTQLSGLQEVAASQGQPVSQAQGEAGVSTDISECLCTVAATAGTTYMIALDGVTEDDTGQFTLTVDDSQWQAATGDAITCPPSVGPDGTVYVGGDDGTMNAYSPAGSLIWSLDEPPGFDTTSAIAGPDGTVYAAGLSGELYAIGASGSVEWTYSVPGFGGSSGNGNIITASPAQGPDGTLYVHSSDGNLYAVGGDGSLKWTAAVPGISYAAPTIGADGTVYIGSDSGTFYAFTAAGAAKWTYTTPVAGEQIYTAAPIDASGNVYFATLEGNAYSLNSAGKLRWSTAAGLAISSAPALGNGSVYFGAYDGNLYALSQATGAVSWRYRMGAQVRASSPAIDASGNVYIGCYDHNVYEVSSSGALVRTFATDDYIRSSPAISGSMMYIGGEDHKLYAFNIGVGPAASGWPMYQYNAQRPGRSVSSLPAITGQPASQSVQSGSPFTLSVTATGVGTLAYQWLLNGSPISGATGPSYSVASASASDAGTYTVAVADSAGTSTSDGAAVTVNTGAPGARLTNISTRAMVGTGANILIPGFYISGSGTETLLIRGDGPALAQFNVAGFLSAPTLAVFDSASNLVSQNTGWGTGSGAGQIAGVSAQVGAFALNAGSGDSAVIVTLNPGAYTVQVSGAGGTTGVALAEIYEVSHTGSAQLSNISTRAVVGTGANILIPGFYISGSGSLQLLVRGDGPGLAQFNVAGILAAPTLSVYSGAAVVASNTGWTTGPKASDIAGVSASVGAFAFEAGSADSATIVNLSAGPYTVQLSGVGGTTGVGLAEIYEVP
jgi:outer membrane protein assembly factor BamB/subtilisin family serine protease